MSLANAPQLPINVGLAPQQAQGARCIGPIPLIFTTQVAGFNQFLTVSDDLVMEGEDGTINTVQSMFFDASNCWSDVVFTIVDTGQTLRLPAKSLGYLPILCSNSFRFSATMQTGTEGQQDAPFINVTFYNTPCQPFIWDCITNMTQGSVNSTGVVAGNTLINMTALAGFSVPPNKNLYVTDIGVSGSGATAEGNGTINLTNIVPAPLGAIGTMSWGFEVPLLGAGSINFKRNFNPPLRAATSPPAVGKPGFTSLVPVVNVPAVGAGNTWMQADIQFFVS